MSQPKQRSKLMSYEDVVENEYYAITINPSDKYQYFRCENRLGKCLCAIDPILYYNKNCFEYILWPEISSRGRVHYHGKIKIINKNFFYLSVVPHLLSRATVYMDEIKDENWENVYCKKQDKFHEYVKLHHYMVIPIRNNIQECSDDPYSELEIDN